MSLKIIMADSGDSIIDFVEKVEAETGVIIHFNGTSYWGDVEFPDGVRLRPASSVEKISSDYNHAFIDVDNHLFIYDKNNIDNSNHTATTYTTYGVFISDTTDGRIISLPSVQKSYTQLFNIPESPKQNATKQSIKILPCYFGYSNDYSGFLKNIYINYERRFVAGLKFVDQNGNRFVTLGSYLLYKVD